MGIHSTRDGDGIHWITFLADGARPPLLGRRLFDDLEKAVVEVERDPPRALLLRGEPGGDFLAGMDLEELAGAQDRETAFEGSRRGQLLFHRIALLPGPTVSLIEGRCVGGGLELALACSSRIAADEEATAFAFPEIHIGILPGFGGSQRLPRLIGQRRALEMILGGRRLGAHEALDQGLVDLLCPAGDLEVEGRRLIDQFTSGTFRPLRRRFGLRPFDALTEGIPPLRRAVRRRFHRVVQRRTRGHYPAPLRVIESVGLAADGLPIEEGLRVEADLLAELMSGTVHSNLLRLVRARQALRRSDPPSGPAAAAPTFSLETAARLAADLETPPGAVGSPAPAGELPAMEMPQGYGLLRRLPAMRSPGVVEAVWVSAAGAPSGFPSAARRLLASAGLTPILCRLAEPSPGMGLLAAYMREGDRLVADGWSAGAVDRILERWGMSAGPFAMARRLGVGWGRRIDDLPARRPAPGRPDASGKVGIGGSGADGDRLIEEVVAVLADEMARGWDLVEGPREAGWSVLDVFALGAPPFRGGILGAAREMGQDRLEVTLRELHESGRCRQPSAEMAGTVL